MKTLSTAFLRMTIAAGGCLGALALPASVGAAGPTGAKAAPAGWTLDVSKMSIPDTPAAGRIHGVDFKPDRIQLENGILTLRQGREFFADLEFTIFLFLPQGEALSGKTFRVNKETEFGNPHVHVAWMPEQKRGTVPHTTTFMNKYAMILEFGAVGNGALPGKIYLCVPDESKSFVAGTFSVAQVGQTSITRLQPVIQTRVRKTAPSTPLEQTVVDTSSHALPVAGPGGGFLVPLVGLGLYLFFTAGYWRVNSKAGLPGWGCLIPFYNLVLWMRCGGKPGWWAVWLFVPPISFVIYVIIAYEIAKNFGKEVAFTVGLVFVPPVFAALLGFGKASYNPTLLRLRRQTPRV